MRCPTDTGYPFVVPESLQHPTAPLWFVAAPGVSWCTVWESRYYIAFTFKLLELTPCRILLSPSFRQVLLHLKRPMWVSKTGWMLKMVRWGRLGQHTQVGRGTETQLVWQKLNARGGPALMTSGVSVEISGWHFTFHRIRMEFGRNDSSWHLF